MTFNDYCQQKGIHLLRDDIKFIKRCVGCLPNERKRVVLERYADIWCEAMAEEKIEGKCSNAGRRKANLFLLETFE